MIKATAKYAGATLVAALLVGASVSAPAQEKKSETSTAAAARAIPFVGKIAAVDKTAKTITLEGKESQRVFQITSATKIMKAGKPATLDDAAVGEDVGGQYKKTEDGKLEAVSVRFGPKPESADAPKPTEKKENPEK